MLIVPKGTPKPQLRVEYAMSAGRLTLDMKVQANGGAVIGSPDRRAVRLFTIASSTPLTPTFIHDLNKMGELQGLG